MTESKRVPTVRISLVRVLYPRLNNDDHLARNDTLRLGAHQPRLGTPRLEPQADPPVPPLPAR